MDLSHTKSEITKPLLKNNLLIHRDIITANFFGLTAFSTFLPFKVYPFFYIVVIFLLASKMLRKVYLYNIFLLLFSLVCITAYLIHPIDADTTTALIKVCLNVMLIMFVSISNRSADQSYGTLKIIELYLRLILLLCFIQVFILQLVAGGISVVAGDSYSASQIFSSELAFFGGDDKNMFGAKVALFGFLQYVLHHQIYNKNHYFYAALIVVTAALSLSRTSLVFIILSFSFFYFMKRGTPFLKTLTLIIILSVFFTALPYVLEYLRISAIMDLERNDGMSIRVLYWISVLKEYSEIGFWGKGILAAREFLPKYSDYYNGEPNVHNLFLNTYLDLGIFGVLVYFSFFVSLFFCMRKLDKNLTSILFAPIFLMINTLYTSYDSEPWMYYALTILIIRSAHHLKQN